MKPQVILAIFASVCVVIPGVFAATQCYQCSVPSDGTEAEKTACRNGDTSIIAKQDCGGDMWCTKVTGKIGTVDYTLRTCAAAEISSADCNTLSTQLNIASISCNSCNTNLCNGAISIKSTSLFMGLILSTLLALKSVY